MARHPRTEYVARLVGLNLYRGEAHDGRVAVDGGGTLVLAEHAVQGPVHVVLRPSAVALHLERPSGSPRNTWPGRVAGLEVVGDRVRVAVDAEPAVLADITTDALADLRLAAGMRVWLTAKASELEAFGVES